jgi:hypothetical protein
MEFLCSQDMFLLGGQRMDCLRDSSMTHEEGGLSILRNLHIPRYSMSGVEYMVGYKTCQYQAGSQPSSLLQNRK